MGLKGDLQEVATVWEKSSWRVKAYLLLSAFLASGSIASLSDTVLRWKGFLRDALLFYQAYISDQLLRVLQFVFPTIHVPAGVSHFLEHLFFKGTSKRTARQLMREVRKLMWTVCRRGGQVLVVRYAH